VSTGQAFIGTSGWSYQHWRERFYPAGVPERRWLEYFAGEFPTVELNSTFYHDPKPETYDGWRERTPASFVFAVKMSRFITHRRLLAEAGEPLDRFLVGARRLAEKLGPVLVQLPPTLERDDVLLARFLGLLRESPAGRDLRYAFEFRHPSWLAEEVYRLLADARISLCWNDYGGVGVSGVVTADFIYLRRHGAGGRYTGCYSDEALAEDARLLAQHLKEGRDAFAYFNNDARAFATENARTLTALLAAEGGQSPSTGLGTSPKSGRETVSSSNGSGTGEQESK
jgi:uncharacterized protein YecE (DUF72 family)